MLSVSPFFIDSFVPNLSAYNMYDCPNDRHVRRVPHREPNYSLTEHNQATYLEVELPGVAKENVKLDLAGNRMVLSAKRFGQSVAPKNELSEKPSTANVERESNEGDGQEKGAKTADTPKPSVLYELKLRIGNRYDLERIEASMEGDGLLKLKIPARKPDTPRSIEIQ